MSHPISQWWQKISFLAWAGMAFVTLIVAFTWFDWQCSDMLVTNIPDTVAAYTQKGVNDNISREAIIRSAAIYYQGIGYSYALLIAASFVIVISLRTIWQKLDAAQLTITLLACVGITYYSMREHTKYSCYKKVFFTPWSDPIKLPHNVLPGLLLVGLATVAIVLLIVAAASIRQESPQNTLAITDRSRIHQVRDQLSDLRRLLYVGASKFAIGVLALNAGLLLNIAPVQQSHFKELNLVVSNLVFVYALSYSAVLFVAFYPSVAVLQKRAYRLADECSPTNTSPSDYLKNHGLDVRPYLHLKDFIAILGPLLVSPFASISVFVKQLNG